MASIFLGRSLQDLNRQDSTALQMRSRTSLSCLAEDKGPRTTNNYPHPLLARQGGSAGPVESHRFGQGSRDEMCIAFIAYWPKARKVGQCSLKQGGGRWHGPGRVRRGLARLRQLPNRSTGGEPLPELPFRQGMPAAALQPMLAFVDAFLRWQSDAAR